MTIFALQNNPTRCIAVCIALLISTILTPAWSKTRAIEVNYLNITELDNELRLDAEIESSRKR